MSQEDYIKEHFNKVDTITAKYVSNESWADGIKDELEEGKIYKVSYISVLRSSTQIMLDAKGTVPPVRFIELVEATVDDENIKDKIAHLLELKKQSSEHNLEPVDEELFNWAQDWAEIYDKKVEVIHPEKKVNLDTCLNQLMFDTVIRKAKEGINSTQIHLFE